MLLVLPCARLTLPMHPLASVWRKVMHPPSSLNSCHAACFAGCEANVMLLVLICVRMMSSMQIQVSVMRKGMPQIACLLRLHRQTQGLQSLEQVQFRTNEIQNKHHVANKQPYGFNGITTSIYKVYKCMFQMPSEHSVNTSCCRSCGRISWLQ